MVIDKATSRDSKENETCKKLKEKAARIIEPQIFLGTSRISESGKNPALKSAISKGVIKKKIIYQVCVLGTTIRVGLLGVTSDTLL